MSKTELPSGQPVPFSSVSGLPAQELGPEAQESSSSSRPPPHTTFSPLPRTADLIPNASQIWPSHLSAVAELKEKVRSLVLKVSTLGGQKHSTKFINKDAVYKRKLNLNL